MSKSYSIVGMNFTKSEEFVKTLAVGTEATLIREPKNAFDPNAVAVWIGGRRVGYVPKKQNAVLAQFIDQNGEDLILNGTPNEAAKAMMGMDNALEQAKFIPAKFFRSPNSAFPMVEV